LLEAYYKEQRGTARSPKVSKKLVQFLFQASMGMGAIMLLGTAYGAFVDPTSWRDSVTGKQVSVGEGYVIGIIFIASGLMFAALAYAGSRLPIAFNGVMPEEDQPTGLAWQMSAAGLNIPTWAETIIPWSAFDRVVKDTDPDGAPCLMFYFINKAAVDQYVREKDAVGWNDGVGYTLDVARTSSTMAKANSALTEFCPQLVPQSRRKE
jgi:hypothetical protein